MIKTACSVLLMFASGCASSEPVRALSLEVIASDENGTPVRGATVSVNDDPIGETNEMGALSHDLFGAEGALARVAVGCPRGTVVRGRGTHLLTLRHLKALSSDVVRYEPLRARFICEHPTRRHVVIVRTNIPDPIPVKIFGKELIRTGAAGVAHFTIEGAPGEEMEIRLDTSEAPHLRPVNPTRRFSLPRQSQFLVYEQRFEAKVRVDKRRRTKRRRGPRRL